MRKLMIHYARLVQGAPLWSAPAKRSGDGALD